MSDDLIACPNCGQMQSYLRKKCKSCGGSFSAVTANEPIASRAGLRMSTTSEIPGSKVVKHLGLVSELSSASGWSAASKGNSALERAVAGFSISAAKLGANAIIGVQTSTFGAGGGITNMLGGDAVGILIVGTAVVVEDL